jgi:hypothetical protein
MFKLKCPICDGEVVERCPCLKANSICINKHKFHFSVKFIKIGVPEVELHQGLGSHFTDKCKGCKVILWKEDQLAKAG